MLVGFDQCSLVGFHPCSLVPGERLIVFDSLLVSEAAFRLQYLMATDTVPELCLWTLIGGFWLLIFWPSLFECTSFLAKSFGRYSGPGHRRIGRDENCFPGKGSSSF